MSRARNIKPGFFKNDILAECDPLARILFAALWCEADRAGRLEDRPKKIKAECLPYDQCDIEILLGQLVESGFIVRYEASGQRYIQIVMFAKHQNPHKNEAPSSIPAPDLYGTSTVQVPSPDGSAPADPSSPFPDSPSHGEREAREAATPAGEAALAMRKAGCHSMNLSHPDFLAALDEGVTPKELADAVTAHRETVNGNGLFTYAVKVARTNHKKVPGEIGMPSQRAGPGGGSPPQSRTQQASNNLRATADAIKQHNSHVDRGRDQPWLGEASGARLGGSPGP